MDGYRVSFSFIVIHAIIAGSQSAVNWRQTEDLTLNVGDRLELICDAINVPVHVAAQIYKINRGQQGSDVLILTNNVFEDDFKPERRPRYTRLFDYHGTQSSAEIGITISGVQPEDAGEYMCNTQDTPNVRDTVKVSVIAPVEEVETGTNYPNGTFQPVPMAMGPIELVYNQMSAAVCRATAYGFRYPNLTALVNGQDQTGKFQFRQFQQPHGIGIASVTTLTYSSQDPDYTFNQGTLSCQATMDGFPRATVKEVKLAVQFPPVFNCSYTEYRARPGDDLEMTCLVTANPPPTLGWSYGATGNENNLQSPSENSRFRVTERNISSDSMEASLYIPKVDRTFYMKYKLTAMNTFNSKWVTFTLSEGDKGPVQAATFTVPSVLVMLVPVMVGLTVAH